MARILDADEVRLMRMRSQRLSGPRATDVPALLRQVGALQAQDTQASRLAVRPRSDGLDAQAVRRAYNQERPVLRPRGPTGGRGGAFGGAARRYLRAYAPVGVRDFAGWAGIALGQARRGFQRLGGEIEAVEIGGEEAWVTGGTEPEPPDAAQPCVRLLPLFDAYLLGYRSRDLALAPQFVRQIQAGGGWIHPTVAVDGRIVGTWRLSTATVG